MPFPTESFINAFTAAAQVVGDELRAYYSQLTGWLSREHHEDGTHGDITATSVTSTGAMSGTDGTFTGTVTQGGLNGAMSTTLSSDTTFGPGFSFTIPFGASWRISTLGGTGRSLLLRDVMNTAETGTIRIEGGTIGAVTDYTIFPHSAGINLLVGANMLGQRLGDLNTTLLHVFDITRTGRLGLVDRLVASTLTGSVNNYAINTAARVFTSSNAAYDITGVAAGFDGMVLWLCNNGSFDLTLKNNSGASAAGNKLATPNGVDYVLRAQNGSAFLVYDATFGYWFVTGA